MWVVIKKNDWLQVKKKCDGKLFPYYGFGLSSDWLYNAYLYVSDKNIYIRYK